MLRQIHIFHEKKHIFTMDYALALGNEELTKVIEVIKNFLDMPVAGKTFNRPMSNYQVFHRATGTLYFLFIVDLVDSPEHIDNIIKKVISKFNEIFPDPDNITSSSEAKTIFIKFLNQIQQDLHSKIAIVGPYNSGKTTLYNMLIKENTERALMNFAYVSTLCIDNLNFDIWDFQLLDNFSLLWNKFYSGADLIILLIDLSNYNFKVINHFLTLYKTESKFSRLLLLANKQDLASDNIIQTISKELGTSAINTISLTSPDAKSKIIKLLREALSLKKILPANFEDILEVAEGLVANGQNVSAMAKYKELLQISNTYQDFSYVNILQQKINALQLKLDEDMKLRKASMTKVEFELPNHVKFAQKVKVKPLLIKDSQSSPSKPSQSLTTKTNGKKKSLSSDDFVIDLGTFENVKLEEQRAQKIKSVVKSEKEIVKPVSFEEFKNFKNESDFVNALQRMIAFMGSSLSLKLCGQYLNELQELLSRSLTFEDFNIAVETFLKAEKKR